MSTRLSNFCLPRESRVKKYERRLDDRCPSPYQHHRKDSIQLGGSSQCQGWQVILKEIITVLKEMMPESSNMLMVVGRVYREVQKMV